MTGMPPYSLMDQRTAIAPNPNTHIPGSTLLRVVAYTLWVVGFVCASPLAWRMVIQLSGHSDLLAAQLKQPGPKPPFIALTFIGLIIWVVVAVIAIVNLIRDALHPMRPIRPYLAARIIVHAVMVVATGVITVIDGIILMVTGIIILWIGFLMGM